ncbi:hypothetical protein [Reyranella sp.]|uniref:hypothetical protein n=1 Tax=Reyranella sp. TaxID=1929291 RepID=UPI003BAB9A93
MDAALTSGVFFCGSAIGILPDARARDDFTARRYAHAHLDERAPIFFPAARPTSFGWDLDERHTIRVYRFADAAGRKMLSSVDDEKRRGIGIATMSIESRQEQDG